MIITSITLRNFKNLNGSFQLSPGINMIVGNNGLGKTNFLESIFYLSRAFSFRHSNERNLINWNTEDSFTSVKAMVFNKNEDEHIDLTYLISDDIGNLKKKYLVNGLSKRKDTYSHTVPTILFLPQHIDIISGSPDIRRKEIDDFCSMISQEFSTVEGEYRKILKNRNKLLKMIRVNKASESELSYWDEGLIETGSKIIAKRIEVLNKLVPTVSRLSKELFDEDLDELTYDYISKLIDSKAIKEHKIRESFERKIYSGRDKELAAAITLYGPQRDDIKFESRGIDIHEFGSRGQQRLVSLIFKLAMWDYYKSTFQISPVILLDDVMSELDRRHSKNLEEAIKKIDTQVVITGTDKEDYSKGFLSGARSLKI